MRPSGVLHVIASMDPEKGGVGKAVRLIISGLKRHGIDSEVVTLDHPDNNFCTNDAFSVFALGPQKSSWQYSKKLVPWLIANFQNYDGIILHGLWLYNSYALSKVYEIAKKKASLDGGEGKKFPKLFRNATWHVRSLFSKSDGKKD